MVMGKNPFVLGTAQTLNKKHSDRASSNSDINHRYKMNIGRYRSIRKK